MKDRIQLILRLPEKLNNELLAEAKNKGISRNALIIEKLWNTSYLTKEYQCEKHNVKKQTET